MWDGCDDLDVWYGLWYGMKGRDGLLFFRALTYKSPNPKFPFFFF